MNEYLITGGTGTLGKTLTKILLDRPDTKGIRVYSRDELKQWQMQHEIGANKVSYILGDVRNRETLTRAMHGVTHVIHTAALKHVRSCEENPLEAVATNLYGAENVIKAAIDNNVQRVMNVSTDKAVYPVNLYGATKLTAEKLFTHAGIYSPHGAKFATCRYGNVLGSRGSVLHIFKKQIDNGEPITVTHKDMTRFWVPINRVAEFLIERLFDMRGSEVFVPCMYSMSIVEMAKALSVNSEIVYTKPGKGEKLHESLITTEESEHVKFVHEGGPYGEGFFIIKDSYTWEGDRWSYDSQSNAMKLDAEGIRKLINEYQIEYSN